MPEIIAKIRSMASLCRYHKDDQLTIDLMEGIGAFLWDVSEDLQTIKDVLYSDLDEKKLIDYHLFRMGHYDPNYSSPVHQEPGKGRNSD